MSLFLISTNKLNGMFPSTPRPPVDTENCDFVTNMGHFPLVVTSWPFSKASNHGHGAGRRKRVTKARNEYISRWKLLLMSHMKLRQLQRRYLKLKILTKKAPSKITMSPASAERDYRDRKKNIELPVKVSSASNEAHRHVSTTIAEPCLVFTFARHITILILICTSFSYTKSCSPKTQIKLKISQILQLSSNGVTIKQSVL